MVWEVLLHMSFFKLLKIYIEKIYIFHMLKKDAAFKVRFSLCTKFFCSDWFYCSKVSLIQQKFRLIKHYKLSHLYLPTNKRERETQTHTHTKKEKKKKKRQKQRGLL
jgi:hypothetical protein